MKKNSGLSRPFPPLLPVCSTPQKKIFKFGICCITPPVLPDYRPYYIDISRLPLIRRKDALRNKIISEPLVSGIGKTALYSDIGFMLLQWIIEQLSGTGLDNFVREKIYDPLGIKDLFYVAHHQSVSDKDYAATELCPWRKVLISGRVHDDNAYVMGGVAGHAGLFGTAESVHAILMELFKAYHNLSSKRIFSRDVVRLFLKKDQYQERALGFDIPSASGSSSGNLFSQGFYRRAFRIYRHILLDGFTTAGGDDSFDQPHPSVTKQRSDKKIQTRDSQRGDESIKKPVGCCDNRILFL